MIVDADNDLSMVQIRTKNSKASNITPEFKKWLDKFNTRYKTALTELAKK